MSILAEILITAEIVENAFLDEDRFQRCEAKDDTGYQAACENREYYLHCTTLADFPSQLVQHIPIR